MRQRQAPVETAVGGASSGSAETTRDASSAHEASRSPRERMLAFGSRQTRALWRWLREPPVRQILALFLVSRLGFILVTYVGYALLLAPKYSTGSVGVSGLLNAWDQWDAARYLDIAAHGYSGPEVTAFFPLYPMLISALAAPFGGQGTYVIALVLSNLAFLGALMLLRPLVAERWGETTAARTVLYLTIFPTALYTFAPYNESLFLLWTVGCFLALTRRRWALAGVLGALAVLTRAAGILLLLPLAYEWWLSARPALSGAARGVPGVLRALIGADGDTGQSTPGSARRVGLGMFGALAWALLLPAALAGFALFCALRFGDALAFVHAQAQWNRVTEWPWVGLWWQLVGLARAAPASFFQVHDLLDLSATLGFIALWVAGWRWLPRAQFVYMGALILLALLSPGGVHLHTNDPLSSNQRFVLEMFPGFIVLALLTERRPNWHQTIAVVSALLLATLSLLFILGRWLV